MSLAVTHVVRDLIKNCDRVAGAHHTGERERESERQRARAHKREMGHAPTCVMHASFERPAYLCSPQQDIFRVLKSKIAWVKGHGLNVHGTPGRWVVGLQMRGQDGEREEGARSNEECG